MKDTASYTGERMEDAPEEVTIRITLLHLAIIGFYKPLNLLFCTNQTCRKQAGKSPNHSRGSCWVRINLFRVNRYFGKYFWVGNYIHVSDLPVRLSWQNLFSLRKSRCGYERFLYLPMSRNWIVEDNVCEANNYRWTRMWTSQYFATMWDRLSLGKDTSLVLLEPIYNIHN